MPFSTIPFYGQNYIPNELIFVASNTSSDTNAIQIPTEARAGDFGFILEYQYTSTRQSIGFNTPSGWTVLSGPNSFFDLPFYSTPSRSIRILTYAKILVSGDSGLNLTGFNQAANVLARRKIICVFRNRLLNLSSYSENTTDRKFSITLNTEPPSQNIGNSYNLSENNVFIGVFGTSTASPDGELGSFDSTIQQASDPRIKLQYKIYNGNVASSLSIDKTNQGEFDIYIGHNFMLK